MTHQPTPLEREFDIQMVHSIHKCIKQTRYGENPQCIATCRMFTTEVLDDEMLTEEKIAGCPCKRFDAFIRSLGIFRLEYDDDLD